MSFEMGTEYAVTRHTEEIKERVEANSEMCELFITELSEREKQIFEIGFANGYCLANDEVSQGRELVQVLIED